MNKKIPKCCLKCKKQICDENGIIIYQYRYGNEIVESYDKCFMLVQDRKRLN